MKMELDTLFDYIKSLCESEVERIVDFVLGIVSASQDLPGRPDCPYCKSTRVIKHGRVGRKEEGDNRKQRFLCHACGRTFLHSTNTVMANSHFDHFVWACFIRDTLAGATLDECAAEFSFSHQTAFNMRHKVLMALQGLLDAEPVTLSGIAELDETFVLDCYKGKPVPGEAGRKARKHGAKAAKRGISCEYVAICTGIQRGGAAMAETVNRAKPSSGEVCGVFGGHIAGGTLVLTDGLRSYKGLEDAAACTVVDINHEGGRGMFNLNTVNSFHSYIKGIYVHYRGVATKYINRYNALFSVAFRCASGLADSLLDSLCNANIQCYWHSVEDVSSYHLVVL